MAFRWNQRLGVALVATISLLAPSSAQGADPALTPESAAALATAMPRADISDESIYFVMTDRYANGETANDRGDDGKLTSGAFLPKDPGYFHGGDLVGLRQNLDRISELGFTALWLTPVVVQRAEQGSSAAYHGYWGLDFTGIDPHFGTEQDFRDLVAAAHSRGMKVYLDIVLNHTADVISFTEGYGYETVGSKPYKSADGAAFNLSEVAGLATCAPSVSVGCFPILSAGVSFPKTILPGDSDLKQPAFLQDVTNYHNRGNISDWNGEQVTLGDFYGLDDVFTEKAEVVEGWADVWSDWVIGFGVDGFRIDTAKHVDDEFFNRWAPLVYEKVAAAGLSLPDMYGEVFTSDIADLSYRVRNGGLQSVLDFPIDEGVTGFAAIGYLPQLAYALAADDFYNRGAAPGLPVANAYSLVTFAGNHDEGRLARQLLRNDISLSGQRLLDRVKLAYAMLMTMRGAPTLYYGDEVGMIGAGGDKEARLDMFPTEVPWWQDQERVGSPAIGKGSALTIVSHPVMDYIKQLGGVRSAHPALTDGASLMRKPVVQLPAKAGKPCKKANQRLRIKAQAWELLCRNKKGKLIWVAQDVNQVAAWSRFDDVTRTEYLVVANGSDGARTVSVSTSTPNSGFAAVLGESALATSSATGVVKVSLPARSLAVFKAASALPATGTPTVTMTVVENEVHGAAQLSASVKTGGAAATDPATVTFVAWSPATSQWRVLGSDDSPSYRLLVSDWMKTGATAMQVAAIVKTTDGKVAYSDIVEVKFQPQ